MLGLSKDFVIALAVGVFFWIGMEDFMAFIWIVGVYIAVKIVWRILTQ